MPVGSTSVFGMKILPELDKQGMGRVTKAIQEGLKGNILDASTARKFGDMAKDSAKSFNTTIAQAKLAGLHDSADYWRDTMIKTQDDIVRAISDMGEMQKRVGKDITQEQYASVQRQVKEQIEAVKERLELEMKGVEEIIDRRNKALEDWKRTKAEGVGKAIGEGFSDSVESMWSNVKSGDLGGLAKALQGSLSSAAGGLQVAGAAGVGGANVAGSMTAAAGAMTSAAAALGVIVGVVAAIGAVVKVMMDADAQAKEFNSTLLQGASQADFFSQSATDGIGDITNQLDAAREAALGLAWEFRGDAKEIMGVISAANEAGLTFKEMKEDFSASGDELEAYTRLAKTAIVYSKNLGQTQEDIAKQTADWMHDLGGGLRTVESGFDAIFQGAMQSGIGVKRFYTMVTSATANMALYNVRIQEAAALISQLGKSLGEANAASFTEGLSKGFAAESYTERFKRLIIAGQGDMKEIMENSAVATAKDFREKFGGEIPDALRAAASKGGVDIDMALKGDTDALTKLGQMSEKQIRGMLQATGSDEQYRQLEQLVELTRGMSGGVSDQAKALDAMDMSGKLATILSGGLGGRALSEMSAIELAAFENYAGISGEQLMELRKVDRQLRGQYDEIADMSAAFQRGEDLTQEQVARLEQLGLEVRDNGKVFIQGTDRQIESFNDYVQTQGDMLEHAVETAMTDQEALALRQTENTTSILNSLDTGIQILLEKIYDVLSEILSWTAGMNETERKNAADLKRQLADEESSITAQLSANADELGRARDLARTTKGEERDKAEALIRELEKEREVLEAGLKENRLMTQGVNELKGGWGPMAKSLDDMRGEVSLDLEDQKKALSPEALAQVEAAGQAAYDEQIAHTAPAIAELASQGTDYGNDQAASLTRDSEQFAKEARERAEREAASGFFGSGREAVAQSRKVREFQAGEGRPENLAAAIASGELTAEGVESLLEQGLISEQLSTDLLTKAEEAKKAQVAATEDVSEEVAESRKTRVRDFAKGLEEAEMRKIARAATGSIGGQEFDGIMASLKEEGGLANVSAAYEGHAAVQSALAEFGYGSGATVAPGVDDFIYRGGSTGGVITPINQADEFLGAKPGGPVDKALAGGGGGNTFNFHISGGDQAKVYATVKRVMRESGIRPPTGTG